MNLTAQQLGAMWTEEARNAYMREQAWRSQCYKIRQAWAHALMDNWNGEWESIPRKP